MAQPSTDTSVRLWAREAAFHIGADIADAVGRYQAATADADFERERQGSNCSSKRRVSGGLWVTTISMDCFASTGHRPRRIQRRRR